MKREIFLRRFEKDLRGFTQIFLGAWVEGDLTRSSNRSEAELALRQSSRVF